MTRLRSIFAAAVLTPLLAVVLRTPAAAQYCPGAFIRGCACPANCNSDRCEQMCSWYLLTPEGRCLYTCASCSCSGVARKPVPYFGPLALLACAASAAEGPTIERTITNEDGEFLVVDPAQFKAQPEEEAGVGIHVSGSSGTIVVASVMENGPAAKSGLKAGDEIVSIDGRKCKGMPVSAASASLKGRSGTLVVLRVRSKDTGRVRKVSFNRVPFSDFIAPKKDLTLRDVPVKEFGGECPKQHQGCNFLYLEKDRCLFTCREKQ